MQHQRLAPGVQGSDHPRLGAKILRVRQQIKQRLPHRLKQQRAHHGHVGQPQRIKVMGQGEDTW